MWLTGNQFLTTFTDLAANETILFVKSINLQYGQNNTEIFESHIAENLSRKIDNDVQAIILFVN